MKAPLQILLCLVPSFAVGWWWMSSSTSTTSTVVARPAAPPASQKVDEAMLPLRAAKDRWTAIHAAIQLARSIPPGERQAWLDGARFRHADPLVVKMFMQELRELLFQQDPYALVVSLIGKDDAWTNTCLARLAKLDPEKLIALGQASADPSHGRRMIFAAMKELVARDPATVLKLALDFPPPPDGNQLSRDMILLLAKAGGGDAEKLLDLADARGDRWRSMLRAAAAQATINKDFAQGLQWIAAQPDSGNLFNALFGLNSGGGYSAEELKANARKVAENLGSLSPEFINAIQRSTYGGGEWPSSYAIGGVEDLWLAADLGRLGFAAEEQRRIRTRALQNIFLRNPAEVVKYLADPGVLTPDQRKAFMAELVDLQSQGVKKSLPPELLATLNEAERKRLQEAEAKFRNSQENPVIRKPLSVAEQFTAAMTEKGSDAMHLRAANWGPEEMDQALTYIRNANPELLAEMVKRIQRTGSPPMPVAAEIYRLALVNNTASKKVREELIETSIHWASRQPVKAAAWVESLPAGPERLCSIQNTAAQWNAIDPAGASTWVASLKDPAEAAAAKEAIRLYMEKTKHAQRD